MARKMGYYETLDWLLLNDDTAWLDWDSDPSVTAFLVADIFGKEIEEVTAALRRRKKKHEKENT